MHEDRDPQEARPGAPGARWARAEIVVIAAAVIAAAWALSDVLLVVFAAVILAVGLDGLAEGLRRRARLPRAAALAVVCAGVVGAIAAVGATVLPPVIAQFDALRGRLTELVEVARDWWLAPDGWTSVLLGNMDDNGAQLFGGVNQLVAHLGAVGMTTFGALVSTVLLVIMAGFLAVDPGLYRRGFIRLVPPRRRALVDTTLGAAAHALRWWFLAQLASMAILGVSIGAGLFVIGIEFWLSLALITALLTFVPYLGPVLAGVPVIAIGFAEGPQTGLVVLVFYLVVQNIESTILLPLIYQKTVRLAPAVTIAAQALMGLWFGVAGFILAAPLTVVAMVLVHKLYVEAALGDTGEPPG